MLPSRGFPRPKPLMKLAAASTIFIFLSTNGLYLKVVGEEMGKERSGKTGRAGLDVGSWTQDSRVKDCGLCTWDLLLNMVFPFFLFLSDRKYHKFSVFILVPQSLLFEFLCNPRFVSLVFLDLYISHLSIVQAELYNTTFRISFIKKKMFIITCLYPPPII